MTKLLKTATGNTTNDYASLVKVTVEIGVSKVAVYIKENNTNAIHFKVLGTSEFPSGVYNPAIHKEFIVDWRDVDARREFAEAIDLTDARNAARQVAEEENKLCLSGEYSGWRAYGIEGLMTATNRNQQASAGAWPANAITDINAAIGKLESSGFDQGPYYLVTRVSWIRKLMVSGGAGYAGKTYLTFMLDNDIINGVIADDMVYASDGGTDGAAVVVPGIDNFALSISMDLTTVSTKLPMGQLFGSVREIVTPHIKQPTSICEITALT